MHTKYTISVYSENTPGVLHRITVMFTRRKTNIESLTVSETETHGVSRFTIVVDSDTDSINTIARQLQRMIDVHAVIISTDPDLIISEVALFKVKKNNSFEFREVLKKNEINLVYENGESVTLQKTGSEHQIDQALRALESFGVLEFVRSGRIAVRRSGTGINDFLQRPEHLDDKEGKAYI